jgi:CHAT domain-containing protein
MDDTLFIEQLRDLSLEDGRAYIQLHAHELADHAAFGVLLSEDILNQLYTNPSFSLKLSELLIFFGENLHHSSSHALGLKAKGDALRVIGLHKTAIECLDAAGEEFLQLGDERNWASSRITYILSCAWLGRVEDALSEAVRARDVFHRLGEDYWACVVDHNTAYVYEQVGRYQEALEIYERILTIYPILTDKDEILIKRAIAVTKCNQAIDLALLGNFEKAYDIQQQSHDIFIALNETSCIISTENNLADLDYTQGYYGSALQRYYHARDILIQNNVDDPLVLAELKLWMAKCLVKLNRSLEACPLAEEAVEVHRQLGTSLQTSNALREYATTLTASGKLQEAFNVLQEAWILFSKGGLEYYASITKLQQAELLLEMGFVSEAYNQAYLLMEYFNKLGLVSRSVRASLVMASSLIEKAQRIEVHREKEQQINLLQEAAMLTKKVALQAQQLNLQEEVYKSHYLLGRLFALQGNAQKATKHYGASIVQIERMLDKLSYDLSPSFLHTTWMVYEDMIALCLQQSHFENAFSYLERARSMALRQYLNKSNISQVIKEEQRDISSPFATSANSAAMLRVQQELYDWQGRHRQYSSLLANTEGLVTSDIDREFVRAELKRCEMKLTELFERLHIYQSNIDFTYHNKKNAARNTKHVDISQMRQQLAPNQCLLAYFIGKGKLVIFVATREQLATCESPEADEQLEILLPLLHAHLQPGGWTDVQRPPQQAIRRLLHKLYNILIAPIADLLPQQSGNLTIVPYGLLHELPFHALYDGEHYLIEQFQVNYLPASNLLQHLKQRKQENAHRSGNVSLDVKPPLIFGYSSNKQIKRTIDEGRMLAEILDGRCYLESEATIDRLIEQAPGSSIIHIATHGQARLDAPNFACVLLANGQFNAIDAFNLDLKGCRLVTLSGCETGKALVGGGDEQLGLGRAFLAAGAESLMMSLWPVEDNATNDLMKLFYQRLLRGDSRVQALRAAQCSLLYGDVPMYTHPYFWASFRLVGETGVLNWSKQEQALSREN